MTMELEHKIPRVSVIVTTYDRPQTIYATIESLLAQTFNDYEILLIDNSVKKITTERLKDLTSRSHGRLRYFIEPIQGKSRASNLGINHAKGEIIAFTDDDVIVDPDWLTAIVGCFKELQCDSIGGRVLPDYPPDTPKWIKDRPHQMAGTVVIYDQGDKIRRAEPAMERFIGCNWAFKRSVFTDCGVFRTDLGPGTPVMGEDEEFYLRLLHKNKKLYYCPQVIIHHPVDLKRLSFKNTADWHIALGRFAAQNEQASKDTHVVHWFGVPRYLWKGIVIDFLRLCASIFYYPSLFDACRSFFRKLGMVFEYRRMMREGRA